MLRAGSGIACESDPPAASAAACAAALEQAGIERADAALVFATSDCADAAPAILDAARAGLGCDALVGGSVHGLLAPGSDVEGGPAVGVVALAGVDAQPFLLTDLRGDEGRVGSEVVARLGRPLPEDLVVLLAAPDVEAESLVEGLRELAPATVVGAGAADGGEGASLAWQRDTVASGAVAGIAIRGAKAPRIGVTQSCTLATDPMRVTRSQGHWVLELDGRPALDVYREVARGPLASDLRRAAAFVLAALPRGDGLANGSFVVRNVVGFDPGQRALALTERLAPGASIALALREPEAAREDLKRMLAEFAEPRPRLGLYLDCVARASALFGLPGLEAGYLGAALGPTPVLGLLGSFEIGPVGGVPQLLTYTGVLALLDG